MTPPRDRSRVIRYSYNERVMHALVAIVFVYLLLTGLAFWTPALYWIAVALGGGFLARLLHPWAGVLFTGLVVWMFAAWHFDMRTTNADRAWRRRMRPYIRNEDDRVPPAGRFNYGQKVFFWAMLWAAAALVVSGVVLWIPESIPPEARVVRELAVLVHAGAALVSIGAFIVHLYMGLAVVPGSLTAIVRGEVSAEWARHHHRLWADEAEQPSSGSRAGSAR